MTRSRRSESRPSPWYGTSRSSKFKNARRQVGETGIVTGRGGPYVSRSPLL
jgi:hypothetical protein